MDNAPRPSHELESIARRWMHAILSDKPKTAVNLFSASDALSYIGSDEGEYWAGDDLRGGYAGHIRENGPSVIKSFDVQAWECADFGWSRSIVQIKFENAEKPVLVRQTMVFLMEDGIWKISHVHNSNPVSNIEAFGHAHKAFDDFLAAVGQDELELDTSGSATVMFTDIVGSSALAEALGDARWSVIVSEHLDAVRRLLERHNGRLVKTMGDGTMSIFQSAGHALNAASDIQKSMDGGRGEPKLALRIGLNTGDIIAAGDDFLGTVVNKAARIASITEPDGIRLSDATRAMVGNTKEYEFASPINVTLKGLEGEHRLYQLNWQNNLSRRQP